jgi:hypothetical protein
MRSARARARAECAASEHRYSFANDGISPGVKFLPAIVMTDDTPAIALDRDDTAIRDQR